MLKEDIVPFLEDLKNRKKTNRQVAEELGVAPESISRVLKQLGVQRIPGLTKTYLANRKALKEERHKFRMNAAVTLPTHRAVAVTGLCDRTIRRWRAKCKTST